MTKISLISLGCSKNLVDSEHMLSQLTKEGYEITQNIENADIGIINTCGFIEAAKTEAIETILETAKYKENGKMKGIIVTGCLAQRYHEQIKKDLPEVDVICGTGSYTNITDAVKDVLCGKKTTYMNDITSAALNGKRELLTPSYTAFLKIAEGCSNKCAYCIIPKLRGKYRSRPMIDIINEAKQLEKAGVKELIIIAQDITKYGLDLENKKRLLPSLLKELCQMNFTWIRLHYLYPDQITDELINVIANEPKIVKYLDIPIQHVSQRILKDMHRSGNKNEITNLINKLRKKIKNLVIRTSIIVGLPAETEAEFTELCEFLKEMKLERVGVFEFSPEEGTKAYEMPNQIDNETKSKRRLIIEELQSEIIDNYNTSLINKKIEVLCEGFEEETKLYFGRTYADSVEIDSKVYFSSKNKPKEGEFILVKIENTLGADLEGTEI